LKSNRRGMALVLTLWILAAMVVLAGGVGVLARTEVQVSRNYADMIRCRWAAKAGENRAAVEVEALSRKPLTSLGDNGLSLTSEDEGIDLGDASFEAIIEDEAGKVNINTAPRKTLENLFGSREVADCIIDWRDKDDQPRALGAESRYYSDLRMPYNAKNGPFDTVQELLLVKGINREMLTSPATADGRTLENLLTVYSRAPNLTVDGKERLNIQTASKDKIKSKLGDVLSDKDIEAIIKKRDAKKFKKAGDLALVAGLSPDKVKLVYDRITVSDKKEIPGLVNVNTAPVEVLSVIPGLNQSTAEQIVNQRQSNGPFNDVGQVLSLPGLRAENFAKFADSLTVLSRVFRIVSSGRITGGGLSSRTIYCVADATDGQPAKIRYWRE